MRRHVADKLFKKVQFDPADYPEWAAESFPDYTRMAVWYCQEVVGGRVPACEWERLACVRFLRMKADAESGRAPYYWDDAAVTDVCAFIEQLKHTKGFAGNIVLEPVQCWWLANIFGFRDQETDLRWISAASLWVPRKNTKTALSVGITLYCATCEGEIGADVVISAGSEGQAHIPYDMVRAAVKAVPEVAEQFKIKSTLDAMTFGATGAVLSLATAKAENLDGLNPHMVLAEELHAQSQKVIGVLRSAQGARRQPLFLTISTAGRDVNAPAYDDWTFNLAVLEGRLEQERLFCVVYAADRQDEEKKFDAGVIEKLNPMWGVSIFPTTIEGEIAEARKSESKLNEYKRTRLNIWARAAGNLLRVDAWNACGEPKLRLEDLKGYPIYVGIDLASRSDLNAVTFMTEVDGCVFTAFRYWLGRHCPRMEDDRFAEQFLAWANEGYLDLTDLHDGTYVDHRAILSEVLKTLEGHRVVGVAVDDYQANIMASEIELAGHEVYFVKKTARDLTPSMEDIIARVGNPNLFQHDANPISAWCAGNVVGHYDSNDNVLPKKEAKGSKANIDGIDALILANAIRIDWNAGTLGQKGDKKPKPNPYLKRGLIGHAA